jgi:hypothetical protein
MNEVLARPYMNIYIATYYTDPTVNYDHILPPWKWYSASVVLASYLALLLGLRTFVNSQSICAYCWTAVDA